MTNSPSQPEVHTYICRLEHPEGVMRTVRFSCESSGLERYQVIYVSTQIAVNHDRAIRFELGGRFGRLS